MENAKVFSDKTPDSYVISRDNGNKTVCCKHDFVITKNACNQ